MAPASAYWRGSENGGGWLGDSWRMVFSRPPTRLPLASMSVTRCPASLSSLAATSPAMPAPTTSTCCGRSVRGRLPSMRTPRYFFTRSSFLGPTISSMRARRLHFTHRLVSSISCGMGGSSSCSVKGACGRGGAGSGGSAPVDRGQEHGRQVGAGHGHLDHELPVAGLLLGEIRRGQVARDSEGDLQ